MLDVRQSTTAVDSSPISNINGGSSDNPNGAGTAPAKGGGETKDALPAFMDATSIEMTEINQQQQQQQEQQAKLHADTSREANLVEEQVTQVLAAIIKPTTTTTTTAISTGIKNALLINGNNHVNGGPPPPPPIILNVNVEEEQNNNLNQSNPTTTEIATAKDGEDARASMERKKPVENTLDEAQKNNSNSNLTPNGNTSRNSIGGGGGGVRRISITIPPLPPPVISLAHTKNPSTSTTQSTSSIPLGNANPTNNNNNNTQPYPYQSRKMDFANIPQHQQQHSMSSSISPSSATSAGSPSSGGSPTSPSTGLGGPAAAVIMPGSPIVSSPSSLLPGASSPLLFGSASRSRRRPGGGTFSGGGGVEAREVLVGTPVKEGHVNYMLMYDMLTGIRISVSRCNAKPWREVSYPSDFEAAHKLAFDVTGNEMTPSSKYDFKFKDYAPWVFRLIREAFHVDPSYYLLSLTGKYVLSELVSSGKSGSFFYYSQDYRFIIKTIHHSEHKFILKVLDKYYKHIKDNPHTLLSRIFGLHRVKLPGNKKIHFVVMGNVFPSNKDIHEVFDLKGSLYGRQIPDEEAKANPRAVMKDLNWLERKRKLILGPEKRAIFERQIDVDVTFLMSQRIMDYSLLVGVHDVVRGNQDHIRDQTLSVFEPNMETLTRRATSATRQSRAQILGTTGSGGAGPGLRSSDLQQLGPSNSKLPDHIPPERRYCLFYADEGGFRASDERNAPAAEIYYIGIIDIFTFYSPVKRFETVFKSIGRDMKTISAVEPTLYARRFLTFMKNSIQGGNQERLSAEKVVQVKAVLAIPSGSFIQRD